MATITQRAIAAREQTNGKEKKLPDFTVRARTGPGGKDWMRVGSAWKRVKEDGAEVITVVLGALPLAINNKVTLKLLEPINEEDQAPADEPVDE